APLADRRAGGRLLNYRSRGARRERIGACGRRAAGVTSWAVALGPRGAILREEHPMCGRWWLGGTVLLAVAATLPAAGQTTVKETLSLFNGRDLTGWKLRGDADKAKGKSK